MWQWHQDLLEEIAVTGARRGQTQTGEFRFLADSPPPRDDRVERAA